MEMGASGSDPRGSSTKESGLHDTAIILSEVTVIDFPSVQPGNCDGDGANVSIPSVPPTGEADDPLCGETSWKPDVGWLARLSASTACLKASPPS